MSYLVERLRSFKENVSNEMIELLETPEVCIQAANEIERLTEASKIDDAEKKRMSAEIGRLRAELAAAMQAINRAAAEIGKGMKQLNVFLIQHPKKSGTLEVVPLDEHNEELKRLRNEIRRLYSEQNAMRDECDQLHAELTHLRDLLHEAAPFTRFVQRPADLWKRIRAALGEDNEPVQKEQAGE